MNKKVLVTGANGQLGLTIKELFSVNDKGIDFIFTTKSKLDITQKDDLKNYFQENQFDYCINCAAYTNVEQAEKTPEIAYKINAEGVKNLAEVCKKHDVVLIHISTDYVFDGEKGKPYTVFDKPNPINEYGKSKLQGEQYIQKYASKYYIVRTSWLYSKKYGHNFYKSILAKAKKEEDLYVTDKQKGCPTNAVNLAEYIIQLIKTKNQNFRISHFTDNECVTWFDFAKTILRENRLIDNVNLAKAKNYCTFAKRPKYSVLGNTKSTD